MLFLRCLAVTLTCCTSVFAYLFPSNQVHFSAPPKIVNPADPAGHPNLGTRLEVTSNKTADLFCGKKGDKFSSGYAHFTNNVGVEDKHMFWFFEARNDSKNAPIVLLFGGGPGASGLLFPFSGAGPCIIKSGENGEGGSGPSPYSWTDHVNLLAIDHPVGVGFSYGDIGALRNSSERAAWDVDDFLQTFWKEYPYLSENQFMIHSGSYGGTYIPHVINTIHSRNAAAGSRVNSRYNPRILKMPDAIMMGNVWSDSQTHFRWFHESNCNPDFDGNRFFNDTICSHIVSHTPPCLDAVQLAYEQPTRGNKMDALKVCDDVQSWDKTTGKNPYDVREDCPIEGCPFQADALNNFMNSEELRAATGVPKPIVYDFEYFEGIAIPFIYEGDMIQPAYLLLAPAIESGLRVLVHNGMYDGACPWRTSLAWMRLLKTKHQAAFRAAPEVVYPGVGYIRQVGSGAGNYTFIKIGEAGHMVILSQPEILRSLMVKWVKNEPFF